MQHGPHEAPLRQREQAEQHIGYLRNRGIGQPLFQLLFFQRQQRAHQDGGQGQSQHGVLHPGAANPLRPRDIEQHPHDAQHAHLGDDAGQDRAGRGRGHGVSGGQPAVQGEHARFHAKADQHGQEDRHVEAFLPGDLLGRHQPGNEIPVPAHCADKENADQGGARANDGVDQILDGGGHGFLIPVMQHQRHGQQGHGLVEHIIGDQIARHRQRVQDALGDGVEQEEPPRVLVMLQVFLGVQPHAGPDDRQEQQPNTAHPVHAKGEGQHIRPAEGHLRHIGHQRAEGGQRGAHGNRQEGRLMQRLPLQPQPAPQAGHHNGQQNRKNHEQNHFLVPLSD